MTDLELQGHKNRRNKVLQIWYAVVADYKAGVSPAEIASKYPHPKTGKPRTRSWVYWVLRKYRNNQI